MKYKLTGACPRCGAPIYEVRERDPMKVSDADIERGGSDVIAPTAHFTCECRKALPEPLPDLDGDALETTDAADRKHLAKKRPGEEEEPASGERSE